MKNRMESATGSRVLRESSSFQTIERAFASSLEMYFISYDLFAEHWRWYVIFLKESSLAASRRELSAVVPPSPLKPEVLFSDL